MDRIAGRTAASLGRSRWQTGPLAQRVSAGRTTLGEDRGAARAGAVAWAAGLVADSRTVYLDTETTGLGRGAEVVDIAVVGSDGRVLFETLVRPQAPIPSDASAIHGIFDGDVADAPSWADIHDALCRLLAGRPVVVYNASFDRRIVVQCGERHGLNVPDLAWHCAMRRYAEFCGEWDARLGRYRWQKLELAVAAFGAAPGGHRAAADALACRAVVLGMAGATDPWSGRA